MEEATVAAAVVGCAVAAAALPSLLEVVLWLWRCSAAALAVARVRARTFALSSCFLASFSCCSAVATLTCCCRCCLGACAVGGEVAGSIAADLVTLPVLSRSITRVRAQQLLAPPLCLRLHRLQCSGVLAGMAARIGCGATMSAPAFEPAPLAICSACSISLTNFGTSVLPAPPLRSRSSSAPLAAKPTTLSARTTQSANTLRKMLNAESASWQSQ